MSAFKNAFSYFNVGKSEAPAQSAAMPAPRSTSNVTRMPSMLGGFRRGVDGSQINSEIATNYEESAARIADTLLAQISMVVDVAALSVAERRRIVDFMLGLTAGIQGSMVRVNQTVFLITPAGTAVNDEEGPADFGNMGNFDDDSLIMSPLN